MELFRVKKGELWSEDHDIKIPVYFGFVNIISGVIYLDVHTDGIDIEQLLEGDNPRLFAVEFSFASNYEALEQIKITGLYLENAAPFKEELRFFCNGEMMVMDEPVGLQEDEPNIEVWSAYYLELEGMRIRHSGLTEKHKSRLGGPKLMKQSSWDHTYTSLIYDENLYGQTFTRMEESKEVYVDFVTERQGSIFTLSTFEEIKDDYESALSLLNGSEVKVRKVCTGFRYVIGKPSSNVVLTYSFPTIVDQRQNNYLPINSHGQNSRYVLDKFFMKSFEKYVKLNKQLEFNVIVGFLNNAERLTSIKERFFINIIAFERLCSRYADYIGASESFVPNEDDFKPIKEDLLHIIQKHEKDFGNYLNRARSIVGGLNRIKPHSTGDKMYRLIQDVGIPIDVDIERLVNEVRHTSVHKGEIGSKEEAYINYNLLDELIREIILRLVGYDGPRASKVLFVETVN